MLKFDLTRKYLVGFLTLAMVLSLFALPVSAATAEIGPIVNATWTVTATPGSETNPITPTPATHTITINTLADGFLANTPSLYVAVGFGGFVIASGQATTHSSTGVYTYTATFGETPILSGTGTYTFWAYIDLTGAGFNPGNVVSSAPVTKIWVARAANSFTTSAALTNPIRTTHTISIAVKDQFGATFDVTPVLTISGPNTGHVPTVTRTDTGTYTATYADGHAIYPTFTDTILITVDTLTKAITKTWTYTPTFTGGSIIVPQGTAYNFIGDTHTVTVSFLDQYNAPISLPYTLYLFATRNAVTTTVGTSKPFTGTGTRAVLTYTSATAGTDALTITGTIDNVAYITPIPVGTKVWYYNWAVTPADAVNVMGAWHNIYIYGATGDLYNVTWSTQFGSTQQPILKVGSSPWSGAIPATGVATITCKAEWPGKYFFDVTITASPARTLTSTTIKVAKSWAQLTGFDIKPPLEINPITQVPTWDVHTVTVTVLGEYPVKWSNVIPNVPPPMGGYYWLSPAGILWVLDAPLAGVPVGWDVRWNLTKNGLTDIWADRVGDAAYLPGNKDLYPTTRAAYRHQDGTALTPIHDLWATSISDANGEASLTYHMEYSSTATWGGTRTCTYYWPCFVDSITATAQYPEQALTDEFGYITGTATKEWRDHAFKLIKYNGHLPIGSNDYIEGAKFFLKRLDLVGTPTYVPPMPEGKGWSPEFAPVTNPPGNGYIVEMTTDTIPVPADPPGVLTTDVYGEALWTHLPHGLYGLYEYYAPYPFELLAGKLFEFTINADAPYWCGPDPKITVHYEANTPTGPYFYKITYCGTKMVGVTFEVTNLDTNEMHSYVTDSSGRLQIVLADFDPPYDSATGTEYRVHEVSNAVLTSYGVYAVPDFYFFIDETGAHDTSDGYFYDGGYNEVWPLTKLPWAVTDPDVYRHWVIDPKIGTPPITPITVTLDLLKGWNLVGVPLVTNDTIANLFGIEFIRAYAWDPTLPGPYGEVGSYWNCGNVAPEPGFGFWVKMDAADEVTMEGMAVGSPVAIDLYEGWNIVANPFETAIDWDTVELGGEPIADTTAMAFSYDGTTYQMADFVTDSMAVGQGFWLFIDADATIEFTR